MLGEKLRANGPASDHMNAISGQNQQLRSRRPVLNLRQICQFRADVDAQWIGSLSLGRETPYTFAPKTMNCSEELDPEFIEEIEMAKTQRKLKKANHGRRPASAKARKAKRRHIKT